jgi:hypothetical protein
MTDLSNIDWFDLYRELKRRGFAVIAFSPDELPARRWEPGSSPRQHVEHPFQCRRVDIAVDANPAADLQLELSITPAFLRRRRRGALSILAGLSSGSGAGSGGTSLATSTATNDGSSETPGSPITPRPANRRHL